MNITTLCESDLLNLQQFRNSQERMDGEQVGLYNAAFSEYKQNDDRYPAEYFETASLIVHSKPSFGQKYCRCGMKNHTGQRAGCGLRKYCPKCARSKGAPVYHAFKDCYHRSHWWFLTISLSDALPFTGFPDLYHAVWDVQLSAFNAFLKSSPVEGAIYVEEWAVTGFLPTKLLPHTHALIAAPDLESDLAEQLQVVLDQALADILGPRGVTADVGVKQLQSEEHFQNVLGYLYKPIDLATPYRSAWDTQVLQDPSLAAKLNSEVRDLLTGWSKKEFTRRQIRKFGSMNALGRRYMGQRRQRRNRPTPRRMIKIPRVDRFKAEEELPLAA